MKKKVFRERYYGMNTEELIKATVERNKLKEFAGMAISSKKAAYPKRAKKGDK